MKTIKLELFRKNKLFFFSIVCYFFISAMIVTLFCYKGIKKVSGVYVYTNGDSAKEVVTLYLNNRAEYHRYKNGEEIDTEFTSVITKWRSAVDIEYPNKFDKNSYILSTMQIDFCNKDNASFFQLLRTNNGNLYSKPNASMEEIQKCYIKQ